MKRMFLGEEMTPLAFGGAAISGEGAGYGFGDISEKDSIELVEYAYDRGVKVYDSAPIYGFGLSEKRIGKALKSVREKVIFVSKSGIDWHENKRVNLSNDPKITEKMLIQSLKSFGTEYIDLYMIHWPDEKVDIRKPLEVLERFREKGVINHIGLCNTNTEELEKAKEIASIRVVQNEFNLFNHYAKESLFEYLLQENIDFMSWGTLDKGILAGNYKLNRHLDETDCRRSSPWWKRSDVEKKISLVEEAKSLLKDDMGEVSMFDLAVCFNLRHPQLKSALIGSKTKERIDQNLRTIERSIVLKDKFSKWDELKNILDKFHG